MRYPAGQDIPILMPEPDVEADPPDDPPQVKAPPDRGRWIGWGRV